MVCPKCGGNIAGDKDVCDKCGASVRAAKRKSFVVNLPDEEEENAQNFDETPKDSIDEPVVDEPVADEPVVDETEPETDEIEAEPDSQETGADTEDGGQPSDDNGGTGAGEADAGDRDAPRPAKRNIKPDRKQSRHTYFAIKLISVVCASIIVLLTVLSVATDIFKNDPSKTVTLSKLSQSEVASFEKYAVKLSALFDKGYSSETAVLDDLLELMHPDSGSGLYSGFYGRKEPTTTQSDPAKRFTTGLTDENGTPLYSFVKVDEGDIEQIAEDLGISAFHDANSADYYYYDGAYYFAPDTGEQEKNKVFYVEKSNRIQSGEYYISGNLYPEGTTVNQDGTYSQAADGQLYFLARLEKGEQEDFWTVLEISDEPLIAGSNTSASEPQTGEQQGETEQTAALSYKMQCEEITVKTSSGLTYANYVVEYPVFDTEGVTQTTIDRMYEEVIDTCKKQQGQADKLYENSVKDGISDEQLPFYTHITAAVTYNDEGRLSLLERTAKYEPQPENGQQEETTAESSQTQTTGYEQTQEQPALMNVSYEGFTFVTDSGDFMKKDELLGKDYIQTQKKLYESYYSSKNPQTDNSGETQTPETIPEDTQGLGEAIYSSAWVLTDGAVMFCYVNGDGALEKVYLPI